MKKGRIRLEGLFLAGLLSIGVVSCQKEEIETVRDTQQVGVDDQNICSTPTSSIDLRGMWEWESTETADGIITADDSEFTKSLNFTDDKAFFYTNGDLVKNRTYGIYLGTSQNSSEADILVIEGDEYTYEVVISDDEVLTITSQDCTELSIITYRK